MFVIKVKALNKNKKTKKQKKQKIKGEKNYE